ncbi:MAG: Mycothiol S-conjugate amidase [Pelotomaculum sp. PtaB.Bin104]|nr:MAG: Mycothiol S-conjugate amidase [Pelotomaculum sp. PtaB.Bin104]
MQKSFLLLFRKKRKLLISILIVLFSIIAILIVPYFSKVPRTMVPLMNIFDNKVLVIAPHPDDEALGTGGVIARSVAEGHDVLLVVMTYGDSFKKAARVFSGKKYPLPEDYVRLGIARRQETINAMSILGLPPEKILFLGYPDAGLENLWDSQWDSGSQSTLGGPLTDSVLYQDAYNPGSPFIGQEVVNNLVEIIKNYNPSEIYYPDPFDDHPDHWATAAFVKYALTLLNFQCREYTYLVHRYLWPQPNIEEPSRPLLMPKELVGMGTNWIDFPLKTREINLKKEALKRYPSQEAVMEPFLWAFIRSTELFAQTNMEKVNEKGAVLKDPVSDTVERFIEGSADITEVVLVKLGNTLRITVNTREQFSPTISYVVSLRFFGEEGVHRIDLLVRNGNVDALVKASNSILPDTNKNDRQDRMAII